MFVGFGVFVVLIGMDIITGFEKNASDATVIGFGYLFAGAGMLVLLASMYQIPEGLHNSLAEQPWQKVRYWTRGLVEELEKPSLLKALWGAGIVVGFFTPFLMFFGEIGLGSFGGVVVIVLAGVFAIMSIYSILRALKYSSSRLEIGRELYKPGEMFSASLRCGRGLGVCDWIEFRLQYVSQVQVSKGSGDRRKTVTVSDVYCCETVRFEGTDFPGQTVPLPMSIEIPIADNPEWTT
ncbi:MAG TPA: hypothetical protein ENL03_06835, partial [Phycisphaerae bacterium]|nr:hypothetical protein [Phycisphaerae bacterium]